ncbi:hypothetical protein [Acidovorax sp. SDU_ACID1]|uniref:hypothetical protein n=1 Tax=Acidovorax sp. SDU_ACID1 TaxID=3136632 RepID=UPI0038731D74
MSKTIHGKVARILNSRELALNIGTTDGVKEGMLFDVLDPKGEDIRDPDTNEILGSLQRPKVRVKIVSVQEKLSVASTYKSTEVNIGGAGDFAGLGRISSMLMPPKYVKRYETLKTTEQTWEDLDEDMSYVKTGDPVVLAREVQDSPQL